MFNRQIRGLNMPLRNILTKFYNMFLNAVRLVKSIEISVVVHELEIAMPLDLYMYMLVLIKFRYPV